MLGTLGLDPIVIVPRRPLRGGSSPEPIRSLIEHGWDASRQVENGLSTRNRRLQRRGVEQAAADWFGVEFANGPVAPFVLGEHARSMATAR
jgi:hypothetical protein